MKTFAKSVDLQDRQAIIDFLSRHPRYYTMNSWNRSTSYAHNVKIFNLGLTRKQVDTLFDMMGVDGFYDEINARIELFDQEHNYEWQAGFNGRSGGYLVLYQGGRRDSGYKSRCTACGQPNYQPVTETNCKCGRCGLNTRVNLAKPIMQSFSYPGKGLDMDEDFEDWDIKTLRERAKIVMEFDQLADDLVSIVADMADNCVIEHEAVMIPSERVYITRKEDIED